MKATITFLVFIFFSFSCNAQIKKKYLKKFDNRINSMAREIPEDSLNFNFHNEEIKKGFNSCLNAIEKNGYLDSLIVQNRFGRASDKIRITLNYRVPFQISNEIIRYFYTQGSDLELLFFDEPPKGTKIDDRYPVRAYKTMLVGSLFCSWDVRLKTITKNETIKKLVTLNNQEEFINFFIENDENHRKLEGYMKKLIGRAHFNGCEEIDNEEVRIACADDKYREYVKENFYKKFGKKLPRIGLNVLFNKNGKVIDVEITNPDVLENPQEIIDFWYAMPNWIPAEINGQPIKKSMYMEMINRID
jgi:hypothetical protein